MARRRVLILGAAGRDFHDFNTVFRDDAATEVIAFTAAQIPNIAGRRYPPELAGPLYPHGIPIVDEASFEQLVRDQDVDEVVFAYSDVSHQQVMHLAARAAAAGADFRLIGPNASMLCSSRPVVSVCAVRTGCGKSPTSQKIARTLIGMGLRVAAVRHPMPYGDLVRQRVQRFAAIADLERHECTIEEMEEYEPYLAAGGVVFAGVDYEAILRAAEAEADVVLWDGGNNDLPFYQSNLEIVVADPLRPGHETAYWPGEANFRRADVLVIAKQGSARPQDIAAVKRSAAELNPTARILDADLRVTVENAAAIRGKRVLVVEDGPTLTHGGMRFGAGVLAAREHGAAAIVDPRAAAVGEIAATFRRYPETGALLPAMGYGRQQMADLAATIAAVDCDLVLVATPIDLRRVIRIDKPSLRVRYELVELSEFTIATLMEEFAARQGCIHA